LNLSPTNAEHSVEATELLAQLKDITEIDLDMLAELDDGKGGPKKEIWQI
jgi:hypothetical protein